MGDNTRILMAIHFNLLCMEEGEGGTITHPMEEVEVGTIKVLEGMIRGREHGDAQLIYIKIRENVG